MLDPLHRKLHTRPTGEVEVSFQLTVLKVLAGQSAGRASVADIRHAVEILMNSGRDWTDRMKRLAERAPDLNIFSAGFVFRDTLGWEITEEGAAIPLRARKGRRRSERAASISHRSPIQRSHRATGHGCAKSLIPPHSHRQRSRRRRGKGGSNRRRA